MADEAAKEGCSHGVKIDVPPGPIEIILNFQLLTFRKTKELGISLYNLNHFVYHGSQYVHLTDS